MSELPERKLIRLKNYDYSKNGYYFITICSAEKQQVFAETPVGANCVRPQLTELGQIIENEITSIDKIYDIISIDKFVIMPNHLHMILKLEESGGRTQFAPTISRIIKQFKGSVTKKIGFPVWQKSFYDHVIRNETSYQEICQYIEENPAKWAEDCYYQK